MLIERPKFRTVPLAEGLKWRGGGGWRYEEKLDGVFATLETHCSTICGERMADGRFFAFDIINVNGFDVRSKDLRTRLTLLDQLSIGPWKGNHWFHPPTFLRPAVGTGAEFLEAVLARGGEGVVAKELDAPYGAEWFKCKRVITLDLVVTEKAADGRSSIRLSELNGEDRGWCPCRSEFENVQVGQIVEVAAYSLTSKGKLREPRFIRIRHDK